MNKKHKQKEQKYKLGEMIGKGAIGYVYKSLDKESGEVVAIK